MNAKILKEIADKNSIVIERNITMILDKAMIEAKQGQYSIHYIPDFPDYYFFDSILFNDLKIILEKEYFFTCDFFENNGLKGIAVYWFK